MESGKYVGRMNHADLRLDTVLYSGLSSSRNLSKLPNNLGVKSLVLDATFQYCTYPVTEEIVLSIMHRDRGPQKDIFHFLYDLYDL